MNDRLKAIRREAKLSQADFGAKLNVGQNYVYMMEAGKKPVTSRMISDICREFHVNEEWLRTGKGEMHTALTKELEIAQITASLLRMSEDSEQYKFITSLSNLLIRMSEQQLREFLVIAKDLLNQVTTEDI